MTRPTRLGQAVRISRVYKGKRCSMGEVLDGPGSSVGRTGRSLTPDVSGG